MSVVIEQEPEVELKPSSDRVDIPPIFGRCPVCGKPCRPRCKFSQEPKAPPVGQGYDSRARCDSCGTIIEYVGKGEWVAWNGGTTEEEGTS